MRLGAPWEALGRSWRRLGASWAHLGTSWSVLGASWGGLGRKMSRLGRVKPPAHSETQLCLARVAALLGRWEGTISNEEGKLLKGDIQTDYRPLQTTLQQTQTRSWAPSGPVRIQSAAELRSRHRVGFKVFIL